MINDPSQAELDSFSLIQKAFSEPSFLFHFDDKLGLFIDLDASKEGSFGAMVYHVKGDIKEGEHPGRSQVQPILFLSRLLKDLETRYWPTELELAGIVWTLSKVRHMVESAPKTVVFTDHRGALGIAKQTTMTTSSTPKTNLRIVRGSKYIQRFRNIEIKHKSGVSHIVPDALFRLQHQCSTEDYTEGELDALWASSFAYTVSTHIQMKASIKKKLLDGYKADPS